MYKFSLLDLYLQVRRAKLLDSIRLFSLFRECDEVESWIKERVMQCYTTRQCHTVYAALVPYKLLHKCLISVYNTAPHHMHSRNVICYKEYENGCYVL